MLDGCSDYQFYNSDDQSWDQANALCDEKQAVLASIESNEEWEHLKNRTKTKKKQRWYIGLKYYNLSKEWCWLSSLHTCLNETLSTRGTWRWHTGEPNNLDTELCVEMFSGGKFNNVGCGKSFRDRGDTPGGYICEKKVGKDRIRYMITRFANTTASFAFQSKSNKMTNRNRIK